MGRQKERAWYGGAAVWYVCVGGKAPWEGGIPGTQQLRKNTLLHAGGRCQAGLGTACAKAPRPMSLAIPRNVEVAGAQEQREEMRRWWR